MHYKLHLFDLLIEKFHRYLYYCLLQTQVSSKVTITVASFSTMLTSNVKTEVKTPYIFGKQSSDFLGNLPQAVRVN